MSNNTSNAAATEGSSIRDENVRTKSVDVSKYAWIDSGFLIIRHYNVKEDETPQVVIAINTKNVIAVCAAHDQNRIIIDTIGDNEYNIKTFDAETTHKVFSHVLKLIDDKEGTLRLSFK